MISKEKKNYLKFIFTLVMILYCTLGAIFFAHAQTCSGSFGDPVVNITFGAGSSTVGQPLAPGITNYPFVYNVFPQDGFYTIENNTATVGKNEFGQDIWWPTTDHTGDKGGYMMVINANLSPTDYFYKQTVGGLCQGTTYEFAAWLLNLLPYKDISPPNIVFTISKTDGTLLGTYSTGEIPINHAGPKWIQYGLVFTTPPGVSSVILKIRDIAAGGGPANDIALDDITFRACGPLISSRVAGNSSGTTLTGCLGNNDIYTFTGSADKQTYVDPVYQWQVKSDSVWVNIEGETNLSQLQVKEPVIAGKYAYRMVSSERGNTNSPTCQVASNPLFLTISEVSIITAPLINLQEGKKTTLLTVASGKQLKYKWTPSTALSNDTSAAPVASPLTDTEYKVVVTSSDGCTASANVSVVIIRPPQVPNSFSPNGDGINDTWDITHLERSQNCSLTVFNRYGEVIFKSAGYQIQWDGTYRGRKLPAGVYYYVLDTHNVFGILSGNLTILY